ncbi:hypothetical protein R1flu_017928 [Riccia fluitans]|uniref:Uncharacterized protein n=1 Tax=Riccia fluitans TaxID=41844 RepID=A0ABD1ZEC6_9MARC
MGLQLPESRIDPVKFLKLVVNTAPRRSYLATEGTHTIIKKRSPINGDPRKDEVSVKHGNYERGRPFLRFELQDLPMPFRPQSFSG